MFNFTFKKIFNTAKELMKICNLPESTFYKFQNEWISKGGDPRDMGKVEVKGGPILWNGPKYVEWLKEYKINKPAKFDYEIQDKKTSEKDYKEAKEYIDGHIDNFKIRIKGYIREAAPDTKHARNFFGRFKNKTVEQVYEEIMNGTIDIIEKDPLADLNHIKKLQKIIAKGVRTPTQIVEDYNEQHNEEEEESIV